MSVPPGLDHFSAGSTFFIDEDFSSALREFDSAISASLLASAPPPPQWFISRSAAHLKLKNFAAALSDADAAIASSPSSASGWWRRGMALFHLDRFADAKVALTKAQQCGANGKEVTQTLAKCEAEMERERRERAEEAKRPQHTSLAAAVDAAVAAPSSTSPTASTPSPSVPSVPLSTKVRDGFHQSRDEAVITLYVKDLSRDQIECTLSEDGRHVFCRVTLSDKSVFSRSWNLFNKADTLKLDLTKYRLEIQLKKSEAMEWPQLEFRADVVGSVVRENERKDGVKPNYPSSAKRKTEWTTVEQEVKKAEEEEKPEGEAALQKLFQTIYKDADESTRRAMVKSFQTSGGTVLSTNWDEVGKTDYEKNKQAPDGQEFREWNDPDGAKAKGGQRQKKEESDSEESESEHSDGD